MHDSKKIPRSLLVLVCLAAWFAIAGMARAQNTAADLADHIRSDLAAGRIGAALESAQAAVETYPNSSPLEQLYGVALFKKGMNAEARNAFRRAIELDATVPQNYFDLALVDLSENQNALAARDLESYLGLEPDNAEAHLLLGRAEHNMNETIPAIEQFTKAIALAPQLPLAHYHLGFAYQSEGKLKAALAEFKAEILNNPRFYDAYWQAGRIEQEQGELDGAQKLFEQAARIKPYGFEGRYGLAQVYLARKDYKEAVSELQKALALNSDNIKAHYALARAYHGLGDNAAEQRELLVVAKLHEVAAQQESGIAGQHP